MDCRACENRLLDLLYEELEGSEAEEAREHLAECDSCQSSFEQLGSVQRMATDLLPMEEPSADVSDRILAAARAKASGEAGSGAADDGGEQRGLWTSVLDWLRGLTIGPQVAMAAVMLLVVAIGLWYVPGDRHGPDAAGETVVSPEFEGEAAPSGALESTPETEAIAGADESAAEPRAGARQREARASAEKPSAPRDEATQNVAENAPRSAEAEEEAAQRRARMPGRAQAAEGKGARKERYGDDDAVAQAPMPAPQQYEQSQGGAEARGSGGSAGTRSAPLADGESSEAEGFGGAPGTRDDYERGLARYRARDYRSAIDELDDVAQRPSPDARRLVPSALHHIARSYKAKGQCAAAVRHYESLLTRHTTYGQRPQAMLEAAACYRRTGRLARAEHWLQQAMKQPGTKVAARRELERVRRTRARREAQETEADTAAPAEANEAF